MKLSKVSLMTEEAFVARKSTILVLDCIIWQMFIGCFRSRSSKFCFGQFLLWCYY
jgi:hypothetical protein